MHTITWRHGLLLGALLACLAGLNVTTAAEEKADKDGFTPIFNGKDFTGWKMHLEDKKADPAKTWSIKDETIICTGHPNGFIYTEKNYKNCVIRYDWMFPRPKDLTDDSKFEGNSGCLVYIREPEKGVIGVWPNCVEVQGMNKRHGELLFIPRKPGEGKYDIEARNKATKPVGEWNTTEILCQEGAITAKINSTEVSSGKGPLTEGMIGFQSEGSDVHFRNIKIKELK
jgi:hypothetical protein